MRLIYTVLIELLAPFAFLVALFRGLKDPMYWERGYERFGFGRRRTGAPCLWLHAVSLGEVNAAAPLLNALRARHPEAPLVLTTATPTGRARARALFGAFAEVRYLPYDTPGAVGRFLERVRPRLGLILETELWPNLLTACRRHGIPVVLVSARITPRSFARYRRVAARLFQEALGELALVAAQSEADADRFLALGAPRALTHVIGNLKLELEPGAALDAQGAAFRERLFGGRPTWVAGSTHEGEEQQVLEAHAAVRARLPAALLVLVPRHPQRFERVAELMVRRGVNFDRRSAVEAVRAPAEVLLVDTMGELTAFYAAADVAFVGGSLVPVGGHNLLEPAALGLPVLTGPHTSNSEEIARGLMARGAARLVSSPATLAAEVLALLEDPARRGRLGALGRAFVEERRGSLDRLLALLEPLLKEPEPPRPAAAAAGRR